MGPVETDGHQGKTQDADGQTTGAKTREAEVGVVFTQTACDTQGRPVADPSSATYSATFEPAGQFGPRLLTEARRRGPGRIRQPVVLGDGAKWIWAITAGLFPSATQIVDLYHAREHLADLARDLEPHIGQDRGTWRRARVAELDRGDIPAIATAIAAADPHDQSKASHAAQRETGYFQTNAERMRYPRFRAMGMFIGSGAVESHMQLHRPTR
jgi:hypothetical protein